MEYEAKLPPRYMEVNRLWDAERGKGGYTGRDHVVAAYKRSFTDRVPVYPIVASFAGTLDGLSIEEYCTNPAKAIKAMLNYYDRYQPDVVLAYNDLAKEAEATGCGVKYSDYVVPVDRDPRPPGGQGRPGAPGDPRSPARTRGCPGSSSCARAWSPPSSRRRSAPSRSGRGPSRCSCGIPR